MNIHCPFPFLFGYIPNALGHAFTDKDSTASLVFYSVVCITILVVMVALMLKARKKRRRSQAEAARKRK